MRMLNDYETFKLNQMRQRELIAEAAQERLARAATPKQARPPRFHRRWLARLGTVLVNWGCRLQSRYEQAAPVLTVSEALPARR